MPSDNTIVPSHAGAIEERGEAFTILIPQTPIVQNRSDYPATTTTLFLCLSRAASKHTTMTLPEPRYNHNTRESRERGVYRKYSKYTGNAITCQIQPHLYSKVFPIQRIFKSVSKPRKNFAISVLYSGQLIHLTKAIVLGTISRFIRVFAMYFSAIYLLLRG